MAIEDYTPRMQAALRAIGDAAADRIEATGAPAPGNPEDDPLFSPELEISRLLSRRKAELAAIDGRIAQMVLLLRSQGRSWERIGRTLDITGEAARLRYGALEQSDLG